MADGQRPEDEARTELIPSVETGQGIETTREMPAVQPDLVQPPPAQPDPAQPDPVQPAPVHDPGARRPLVRTDDPVGQRFEPSPPPVDHADPNHPAREAAPEQQPSTSTAASSLNPRAVLTALIVIVLVAVVAVAGWKIGTSGGTDKATGGASSASSARTVDVTITSLDPSGGSGFRKSGAAWVTQTYTSATFGNLKKGVGLVLDLGDKQAVDEVTFTSSGTTVSLRAADSTGQLADGYTQAGTEQIASGATTLSGDGGGEHRYWMIWVSKLAPSAGGYSAKVSDISVRAG